MKWDRFRPIAYCLSEKGIKFPLQQAKSTSSGSRDDQISMWVLLQELEGKSYKIEDELTRLVITMETETRTLKAATGILTVTNLLLEKWQQGIKPFSLVWFWLESSEFEAGNSHTFFVVDQPGDRIISEEMRIVEGPEPNSRFDRAMFEVDHNSMSSGLAAYWYGRFYQETKVGKVYTLASGWKRPKIFYHSRGVGFDLRVIRYLLTAILVCLILILILR